MAARGTTRKARRGRFARPRFWIPALGLVAALAVALVGFLVLREPDRPARPVVTEAELVAYEKALLPIVQRGGKVVEQGMRAGLRDLTDRHVVPPEQIAREAQAWAAELAEVRRLVAALEPPSGLAGMEPLLDRSLAGYLAAAEEFRLAALAPAGAERDRHVDLGVAAAEAADDRYDEASALLQRARRALDLPPSPDFPDPGHDS